jgi:hypothetical protein
MERRLAGLRGRFLGYLFDGIVKALQQVGKVPLSLPRLSSPAYWCTAAAPAFGWDRHEVLALFRKQERAAQRRVAANDPVAAAVFGWMTAKNLWRWPAPDAATVERFGLLSELHTELTARPALYAKDWPKLASEFAAALRCAETALAACGIEVTWQADGLQLVLTRRLTADSTKD